MQSMVNNINHKNKYEKMVLRHLCLMLINLCLCFHEQKDLFNITLNRHMYSDNILQNAKCRPLPLILHLSYIYTVCIEFMLMENVFNKQYYLGKEAS